MLTRIGIGVLIALALDPVVGAIERRWRLRRGFAVAIVALSIAGARRAARRRARPEGRRRGPPVLGAAARDDRRARGAAVGRAATSGTTGSPTGCRSGCAELPEQFTDERVAEVASALVSGIASVAIVVVVAIAVLIDGREPARRGCAACCRRRAGPQADAVGGVMYRTLGRYFGGSITVAVLMGLYVLALGLVLGIPLVPLAALWAMLTDLIPQVGGFLGGAFLVLLATTQGVTTALIAGVASCST